MKKTLLATLVMLAIFVSASLSVFAAPGRFINSPSQNLGPTIVEYEAESDECTAEILVTPYAERETLKDNARSLIERAYDEIVKAKDLGDLCAALKALAQSKGIRTERLAVVDLFDISLVNCPCAEKLCVHGPYRIVVSPEVSERFVALMHYRDNGTWELVSNAKLVKYEGKDCVEFSVDEFSPFAIVVDTTGTSYDNPKTSDSLVLIPYAVICVSALVILTVSLSKRFKKDSK